MNELSQWHELLLFKRNLTNDVFNQTIQIFLMDGECDMPVRPLMGLFYQRNIEFSFYKENALLAQWKRKCCVIYFFLFPLHIIGYSKWDFFIVKKKLDFWKCISIYLSFILFTKPWEHSLLLLNEPLYVHLKAKWCVFYCSKKTFSIKCIY